MVFDDLAIPAELSGLILGLGLGMLVGIQRGWAQRKDAPGTRFAGVRTFGLLGLAGGVGGLLAAGNQLVSAILLATTALLILAGYIRTTQGGGSISGTASIAGLLTVACGFMAAQGDQLAATAVAVAMALLLALRRQLHTLVRRMSEAEVLGLARFALIALVILPLLPDRDYGPYDAWNPRQLWMVVVLVSGFSLVGFVLTKFLGPTKGTIAAAAAGSMVSSTAVTASLAAQLRDQDEGAAILHASVCAASAVMFARVLVLTGALAPFALTRLVQLAAPGLVVSIAAMVWFLLRARRSAAAEAAPMSVRNPFALGPALVLVALVMAMTLAARWVLDRFGDAGVATVLAISGAVDVDSAIIAMGSLPPGALAPGMAGLVLLPPVVLNTLFKAGVLASVAGWRKAWPSAAALVASALASLVALLFVLP